MEKVGPRITVRGWTDISPRQPIHPGVIWLNAGGKAPDMELIEE
jgi:hypothetical protein